MSDNSVILCDFLVSIILNKFLRILQFSVMCDDTRCSDVLSYVGESDVHGEWPVKPLGNVCTLAVPVLLRVRPRLVVVRHRLLVRAVAVGDHGTRLSVLTEAQTKHIVSTTPPLPHDLWGVRTARWWFRRSPSYTVSSRVWARGPRELVYSFCSQNSRMGRGRGLVLSGLQTNPEDPTADVPRRTGEVGT